MMKYLRILALIFMSMIMPVGSAAAYDVSAYFLDVDMSLVSLSPSGKLVAAYEAPTDSGLFTDGRIAIRSSETGEVEYQIPVFNRDVTWIEWVKDDQLAIYARGFLYQKNPKAKKIGNRQDAIDIYNIKNGKFKTAYQHVYVRGDTDLPLVKLLGVDPQGGTLRIFYKKEGAAKLQIVGQGYDSPKTILTGTSKTTKWLLDGNLQPTIRIDQGKTSYTFKYYRSEGSSGNRWATFLYRK